LWLWWAHRSGCLDRGVVPPGRTTPRGRLLSTLAASTVRRWLGCAARHDWTVVGVSTSLYPFHTPSGTIGSAWCANGTSALAPETIIASQSTFVWWLTSPALIASSGCYRDCKSATGLDIKHRIRQRGPPDASHVPITTCRRAQPTPYLINTF